MNKYSILVNIIVTASNLAAIPSILAATSLLDRCVILTVMFASMLMHISERKHRLEGISPFNRWSWKLEMVDKTMAWVAGIYFVSQNPGLFLANYPLVIFGLAMVGLAERYEGGYVFFTITHLLWHFSVYRMTYLFVTNKSN